MMIVESHRLEVRRSLFLGSRSIARPAEKEREGGNGGNLRLCLLLIRAEGFLGHAKILVMFLASFQISARRNASSGCWNSTS